MGSVCAALIMSSMGNTVFAQSTDSSYRVNELEEQVRQLNGRIEDLNFQLLQMQELIRKMQEDNEFRFQELEERSDAGDPGNSNNSGKKNRNSIGDLINPSSVKPGVKRLGKPQPPEQSANAARLGGENRIRKPRMIDGVELYDGSQDTADNRKRSQGNSLGTVTFDANGNIVESAIGSPIDLTKQLFGGSGIGVRAALPENSDELYALGYSYIQSGDYALAEEAFKDFLERFPNHRRMQEVNFWLGESHFARQQYKQAARIFLKSHRTWPNARLAPQTLLKLGVSVAGLDQRELACATYAEVGQKYPNSSIIVKRNVKVEQAAARCSVN